MIIGMFDADASKYTHVPFNLELMKMSTYYKGKHEIVRPVREYYPERYSKFIVRQDYYDGDFPEGIREKSNIEYGGHAFSGSRYIALPEEIELCKPDKTLYLPLRDMYLKKDFPIFLASVHARLSLDGKTIWPNYLKPIDPNVRSRTIFFNDYDLNKIKDGYEAVIEASKMLPNVIGGQKIGMKFPVQVENSEDLFKWSSLNPSASLFSIQYNGFIDDEIVAEYLQYIKGTIMARQLVYNVSAGPYTEKQFLETYIQKIFRQVIFLQRQEVRFSLKYDDNFFSDIYPKVLLDLINCYINQSVGMKDWLRREIQEDSFYNLVSHFKPQDQKEKYYPFSKDDARALFKYVKRINPELFTEFYDTRPIILKGGELVRD